MSQFYERKKAGQCTKCGRMPVVSKRGLLCQVCLSKIKLEHEAESAK